MDMVLAMWGHGHMWAGGGWWWPAGWIAWLVLFWGAVAALVVYLVRRRPAGQGVGERAEAVLAERYARGEISEKEYRERLSVLKGPR
ncbi:MAG: SHOCT domain-containing protein [Streptosporangiaceae bacterium]